MGKSILQGHRFSCKNVIPNMARNLLAIPLFGLMACAPLSRAPAAGAGAILISKWPGASRISVTSKSFASGGSIPLMYSSYGANVSPQLSWSALPAGTVSVFIACEDPDAPGPVPYVHWLVADVPGTLHELSETGKNRATTLEGGISGTTSSGTIGYFGPKPPPGDPPHHYHFEVFAVDTTLNVLDGFDRTAAIKALQGHVIGSGEIVRTFRHN